MIDITLLRKNSKELTDKLSYRISPEIIKKVLHADEQWRHEKCNLDQLLTTRNELSKKAQHDPQARKEVKNLKEKLENTKKLENKKKNQLDNLLASIPNIPSDKAPRGRSEKDNVVLRECGQKRTFDFTPREYLSLKNIASMIGLVEAAQSSGARFAYMKANVAKLEFALLQFAVSTLSAKGFELVFPPTILKKETMQAMGYLDQAGEQEVFHLQNPMEKESSFILAGTGEQSLGGMCVNKLFVEKELPKRYMAFTPCYRREAGSYGKDTKGIFRLHQFEKVEMFSVTTPEQSENEHEFFLSLQEEFMNALEIPYRVIDLAIGDLGLPSSRTFDIESFFPGQNSGKGQYRETHSTSNCTDFQARRLNARYTNKQNKKEFVHTVNGTAFAMQRIIIAILENYQTKDGGFSIPKKLKTFFPQ
ncbi:MAG: serine--tRNA ligase [Patescibacteria group bacterium]|jgi:seryl-tRNA synthetase